MGNCAHYEPTIEELLAEPAIRALMRADGVSPGRLHEKMLRWQALHEHRAAPRPGLAAGRAPAAMAACR